MDWKAKRQEMLKLPVVQEAIRLVDTGATAAMPEGGLCVGEDPTAWFPPRGHPYRGRDTCNACPVAAECLAAQCVFERSQHYKPSALAGMFGGLSATDRGVVLGVIAPSLDGVEKEKAAIAREPRNVIEFPNETRTCTDCEETFPASSRYFHGRQSHGRPALRAQCRTCWNVRQTKRRTAAA